MLLSIVKINPNFAYSEFTMRLKYAIFFNKRPHNPLYYNIFFYIILLANYNYFREKWGNKMANIKSAKKRVKTIEKKTARNIRVKNHVKEAEKAFLAAIEAGDVAEAEKTFKAAEKKIMQAAAKGTMHSNTASRKVGRLAKRLNNLKADN